MSAAVRVARGAAGAAGAAGALLGAAHVAPAATWLPPVRRALLPRLSGAGRSDHVALTFDDGPDPASTPRFLAELDRLGIRATFFMLGCMVRAAPSLAAEVASAGHEIAVHGDVHRNELGRTPAAVEDDLRRAVSAVAEATGVAPAWFRPPFGVLSAGGARAARRAGLPVVLWSAWGRDWRAAATPATVTADVVAGLEGGGTVLLHDSDCTSSPGAWRSALGAVGPLTDHAAHRGWTIGPLADHAAGRRRL